MLFSTLVLQCYLKNEEKKMIHFWGKKEKKNQNSVTIIISVDGKGTVFPVNYLNKDIEKREF